MTRRLIALVVLAGVVIGCGVLPSCRVGKDATDGVESVIAKDDPEEAVAEEDGFRVTFPRYVSPTSGCRLSVDWPSPRKGSKDNLTSYCTFLAYGAHYLELHDRLPLPLMDLSYDFFTNARRDGVRLGIRLCPPGVSPEKTGAGCLSFEMPTQPVSDAEIRQILFPPVAKDEVPPRLSLSVLDNVNRLLGDYPFSEFKPVIVTTRGKGRGIAARATMVVTLKGKQLWSKSTEVFLRGVYNEAVWSCDELRDHPGETIHVSLTLEPDLVVANENDSQEEPAHCWPDPLKVEADLVIPVADQRK